MRNPKWKYRGFSYAKKANTRTECSELANSVGAITTDLFLNWIIQTIKLGLCLMVFQKVICGWMLDANMDSSGMSSRRATERPFQTD